MGLGKNKDFWPEYLQLKKTKQNVSTNRVAVSLGRGGRHWNAIPVSERACVVPESHLVLPERAPELLVD